MLEHAHEPHRARWRAPDPSLWDRAPARRRHRGIIQAATPTFQAAGALQGSTGAPTIVWPTHLTDDIGLLFVESANEAITLSTPSGFVQITGLQNGVDTAGGTAATRIAVFWARATSAAMANVVIADSGNHTIGVILTFRGCITTGNPWNVVAGDATVSASTAVAIPGITTTVANVLAVWATTWTDDNDTNSMLSVTCAGTSSITSRFDEGGTAGNGGGFSILTGIMANTQTYGTATGTLTNTSQQGRATIGLKGPVVPAYTTRGNLINQSSGRLNRNARN